MKRNYAIAVMVLILILSFGVYFLNGKKSNKNSSPANQENTAESPKSLKDLLGLNKSQKCTFDGGTIYLSNGKMRGDFQENSHMIVDGTTSYIWTDDQNSGFKMTFDPSSVETDSISATTQTGFDYQKAYNYDCNNWSLDASVFELPKDVKFQDFSSLMPTVNPEKSGGNTSQCGYCDGLDGDSKLECRKALNCN